MTISRQKQYIAQAQRDLATWPETDTRRMLEDSGAILQQTSNSLPQTKEFPSLLKEIEHLSLEVYGLNLKAITNESETGKNTSKIANKNYAKATYKLSIEGDYQSLLSFISDLEKGKRLINIENITLKRLESEYQEMEMKSLVANRSNVVVSETKRPRNNQGSEAKMVMNMSSLKERTLTAEIIFSVFYLTQAENLGKG